MLKSKSSKLVQLFFCWISKDMGLGVPMIHDGLNTFILGYGVGGGIETVSITRDVLSMSWEKIEDVIRHRLGFLKSRRESERSAW